MHCGKAAVHFVQIKNTPRIGVLLKCATAVIQTKVCAALKVLLDTGVCDSGSTSHLGLIDDFVKSQNFIGCNRVHSQVNSIYIHLWSQL